jgi:hypothetical protein
MSPPASGVLPEKPRSSEHTVPGLRLRPVLEKLHLPSPTTADTSRPISEAQVKTAPPPPAPPGIKPTAPTTTAQVMAMQSTYGNAAMARAVTGGEISAAPKPAPAMPSAPALAGGLVLPAASVAIAIAPVSAAEKTPVAAPAVSTPVTVATVPLAAPAAATATAATATAATPPATEKTPVTAPAVSTPPTVATAPLAAPAAAPGPAPTALATPLPVAPASLAVARTKAETAAPPAGVAPTAPAAPAEGEAVPSALPVPAKTSSDATIPAAKPSPPSTGRAETFGARPSAAMGGAGAGPIAPSSPPAPKLDGSSSDALLQSLASVPASSFGEAVNKAHAIAPEIQKQEQTNLHKKIPEAVVPTGLPRKTKAEQPQSPTLQAGKVPEMHPASRGWGAASAPQHISASGPPPAAAVSTAVSEPVTEESQSWWSWLVGAVKGFLGELPTSDPGLNTSAGSRPKVELSGEADPARAQSYQDTSSATVRDSRHTADAAAQADFGEHQIYPTVEQKTKKPRFKSGAAQAAGSAGVRANPPDLPADARSAVDKSAAPFIREHVEDQAARYKQHQAEHDQKSEAVRKEGMQRLDAETKQVRSEQEGIQRQARADVILKRKEWQSRNLQLQQDFDTRAAAHRRETEAQIDHKVRETDQRVDNELADSERKANEERRKAEVHAAEVKRDAEQKPQSFWEQVKGGISSFFEGLKKVVNGIFDGLRWVVKQIIEGAKAVAHAVIEVARMAIVGLIYLFGEFVKGLVTVVLFAFPETAKAIRDKIDGVVKAATDAVNAAAEWLKKVYDEIYDWLGQAIDSLLHLLQAEYNTALELLRLLATGQIGELWEKLKTLAQAAWHGLDFVEGEIYRELIGFDLTKDLGPQLLGAGQEESGEQTAGEGEEPDRDNIAFLLLDKLRPDQVDVDPVTQIEVADPLQDEIDIDDGDEIPLGQISDSGRGQEAVVHDLLEPVAERREDVTEVKDEDPKASTEPVDKEVASLDPEMSAIVAEAFIAKTRGDRLKIVLALLWVGIKKYWREKIYPNLWWIIPAAIVAIAAVIALEILTAGAVTAALPIILEVVAVALLAADLARMSGHFATYLEKGMAGQKEAAAHAFARGLAVGIVSVVMLVLFEVVGKALKLVGKIFARAARATAKAAKAIVTGLIRVGRAAIKGIVKAVLFFGRLVVRLARITAKMFPKSAEFILERGKLVFRGIERFFVKAVKNLEDLFKRLKEFFHKFKGFSLERRGEFIILFAEFNPRFRIAIFPAKWTQAWDTSKNAKILRENMEAAGKKLNPGDKAHHLVPSTHPRAAEAREILEKFGVDVNAAENGLALKDVQHAGLHTHKYIDEVTRLLRQARSQKAVMEVLERIAKLIKAGRFP